jgi:predicted transcriptional regulator
VKLGIAAADRGDFVSAEKVWEDAGFLLTRE